MNFPTYPVGTLVQIISAAEFDVLPKDYDGYARFLDPFPNGKADYMSPKRRSLCGSIMQIDREYSISGFYFLKPYDLSTAVDPSAAARFSWNTELFTPNEFHPYDTPVPVFPVSFDDFLKDLLIKVKR
jgi:hypothetical protein